MSNASKKTVPNQEAYVPEPKEGFRPKEYGHVVFQTSQLDTMVQWYCDVAGMQVVRKSDKMAFLTWDDCQDRLALMQVDGLKPRPKDVVGFNHVAFEVPSLKALSKHYKELKAKGISPTHGVNHAVSTAIYYDDPDGNQVELTSRAFSNREDINEWFQTGAFELNPLGVHIDIEELMSRIDSGESEAEIKKPHPEHNTWLADVMAGKIDVDLRA